MSDIVLEKNTSRLYAVELDDQDELKSCRDKFHIPKQENGNDAIYLCGNSLGLQPKEVELDILQELKDWRKLGVRGHVHAQRPWVNYEEQLTGSLTRIIGARDHEVVAMNSLSVNLHLMMVSFYQPTKKRYKIIIEKGAFPSDKYAVESQLKFHGHKPSEGLIELTPRTGEVTLRDEDILEVIAQHKDEVALILMGGVNYYTGQVFDMKTITKQAQQFGIKIGWDLAHAVGNINLELHDWNVDFACWCSYKYLNGGPGAVAGLFVHERYREDRTLPRFEGWWGHDKETRFLMPDEFSPIQGAEGWQLSNVPIFSTTPLLASFKIFDSVDQKVRFKKSKQLTDYIELLINSINTDKIKIITPRERRGSQLSIQIKDADKGLFSSISEAGVIADWREPDVIRVAPTALYNSFEDCFNFYQVLMDNLGK